MGVSGRVIFLGGWWEVQWCWRLQELWWCEALLCCYCVGSFIVVWWRVVGCDVVWCGVVWCSVVWCGVVWCGVV